jgi:hypothetical protein
MFWSSGSALGIQATYFAIWVLIHFGGTNSVLGQTVVCVPVGER